MEALSVFDMLKVGVGPSSSHTLGPWRAVQRWLGELDAEVGLSAVERIQIRLYGSLALTGRGHCTDQAVALALMGFDPETVDVDAIPALVEAWAQSGTVEIAPGLVVPFDPVSDLLFFKAERLPGHANGMVCRAGTREALLEATYYSVGGGFVVKEGEAPAASTRVALPYPAQVPAEMLAHCRATGLRIADVVRANERAWATPEAVRARLMTLWGVMRGGIYRGCHTDGVLPGGLEVRRRAAPMARALMASAGMDPDAYPNPDAWLGAIAARRWRFADVLRWTSAFALAINEENANLGRVVTAPTNGAAGVIPAVLGYLLCFTGRDFSDPAVRADAIADFLLVAGEVGTFFKKGATISAAMGGCQAEVGVSSSMAAAALCEGLGGTPEQAFMAAEIAMEHHLGMTCDPIGGLVQIPCIERNTMGAVKAINAAELALDGRPELARVSLDDVIVTLRETAADMSSKYKETSQGGLAVNVSVAVTEC